MLRKIVTANVPVTLGDPPLRSSRFHITALSSNVGTVYVEVGKDLPLAANAGKPIRSTGPKASTKDGIPLARGEYVDLDGPDLYRWWMDGATAGDAVAITPLGPCSCGG